MSALVMQSIERAIAARNRELTMEAVVEVLLGVVFTLLTFGGLFWISFIVFIFFGPRWLPASQQSSIFTLIFLVVSVVSAWRRVDPLQHVRPMTPAEELAMMVGMAVDGVYLGSPRHAVAGAAVVLIAGPLNLFTALETWSHRIRIDHQTLSDAAGVITLAGPDFRLSQVSNPAAVVALHRVALIKIVPRGSDHVIELTATGRGLSRSDG